MSNHKSDDSSSESLSRDSEFESKSNAEDFEDYKLDGYHPVSLGDTFNNGKYVAIQKLGWGHFSTVWLVHEKKNSNYFALKIQKSKKNYYEAAMDELQICEHLNKEAENEEWLENMKDYSEKFKGKVTLPHKGNFVIRLCDNFTHYGIHGKHPCSVFEVMGPNLLDLIQHFEFNNRVCDVWLVKHICIQVLLGLDYIHRICGIIHTDLKPENVMFALDQSELEGFVQDLQNYKKKPLSMKFLRFLKNKLGNSSNKNKKKYQKKKNKKKLKVQEGLKQEEEKIMPKIPENIDLDDEKNVIDFKIKVYDEEYKANETKFEESKEKITQNETNTGENIDDMPANIDAETEKKTNDKPNANEEKEEPIILLNQKSKDYEYDPAILRWKDHVQIPLNDTVSIKLVDFGNACWVNKHYTERIQTREYRSPEAILGIEYGPSADIWSFACMVFEMLTNTFLFKPRKGEDYGKNEDHLALMIETLGKIPKSYALSGKKSRKYFNKNGQLIRIKNIKEYKIKDILFHDFNFDMKEAEEIEEFLLPMLEYDPKKRIDARTALQSKWLWN